MPKINPEYLESIYKSAPGQPGSGRWCQWITQKIEEMDNLREKIIFKRREKEDLLRLVEKIDGDIKTMQDRCGHEHTLVIKKSVTDVDVPYDASYIVCTVCGKESR